MYVYVKYGLSGLNEIKILSGNCRENNIFASVNQSDLMASIKFVLKSESNQSSIYVRLIDGRKTDVMAKTNFIINSNDWSKAKQQPKNLNDVGFKNLNSELAELKANLLKHYNRFNGKTDINTKWLKDFINPPSENDLHIPLNLVDYIDYYIDYRKHELKYTSIQKFNVIKKKLKRFEISRNKTILIIDINDNFKKEFVEYYKANSYSQNTMHRDLVFIKTFCKHARYLGIETHPQLDALSLEREKVEKIFLSFQELELIENINKDKLSDSLNNVRDWLLISCYTGQRISDFMRFSPEMIRYEGGKSLIEFTQKKTGKIMTLPLHKKVVEILKKRNGSFPYPIADTNYNEHVKSVCRIAGITKKIVGSKLIETTPESKVFRKVKGTYEKCDLVTSHIGRRSFASNFYGMIPTSLLIGATGHSSEAMFLNYIGKSNSDKAKQLAEYF